MHSGFARYGRDRCGTPGPGESRERILAAYPYLEPADLDECLAYAAWRLEEREEDLVAP